MPEGNFPLTQAALYLATAPKSNSALAFFDALKAVEAETAGEVPNHLRDPSRDKHGFGHGEGYSYPHAYRDHWVAQAYLPEGLKGRIFYQPSSQGYEKQIQEGVVQKREAQMASMIEEPPEVLTYSPGDKQRDAWMRRTTGKTGRFLEEMRGRLFSLMKAERHHRILVWRESGGINLWEAWRQVPEGGVTAYFPEKKHLDLCNHFARTLPEMERPLLIGGEEGSCREILDYFIRDEEKFEHIICRNWLFQTGEEKWNEEWGVLKRIIPPGGSLLDSEPLPGAGSRLSGFLKKQEGEFPGLEEIREAEENVYSHWHPSLVSSSRAEERFRDAAAAEISSEILSVKEERLLTEELLNQWLNPARKGNLGSRLAEYVEKETLRNFQQECIRQLKDLRVSWESFYTLIRVSF